MRIEASKHGIDTNKNNFSVFPGLADFINQKPSFTTGEKFINLTKGFDIKLEGEAKKAIETVQVNRFAIKPTDFRGMSPIPKIEVEIGQSVKAGDVLFYDKKRDTIQYVAPVSGEIVAVERGEKRSIASVVILADKKMDYRKFTTPDFTSCSREELVSFLQSSGLWTLINERPFDRVPDTQKVPVNIFISTFDTAPLAPDFNFVVSGNETSFQKGLDVLKVLTSGFVHLGLDGRSKNIPPHDAFRNATGVKKTYFSGKHPAGNVGIQIHHVAPIKSGQTVWTLGVQDVITIGNMFLHKIYDASRIIALTGAELKSPAYVKSYIGCNVADLLKNNIAGENNRIVSGDVLSGKQVDNDGFLGYRDDQITVIKEGNDYELFGWLLPQSPRPSLSGTFPNFLYPDHQFTAETNTHGEKRAMVVTGQYEEVLPVDTYPQHLFKAILTNNIEKMEGLGILELTEEDVALCEFACTSKSPLQKILRDGLEIVKEQS
ncbi:MAG: Na(+)-translocating NADH-quinone reductase subunit A [Saprospiraceae bacterium]|nr:Na(+)-translocating NADH-quinone reductase subunit A [Saprospiraceae bacterium]